MFLLRSYFFSWEVGQANLPCSFRSANALGRGRKRIIRTKPYIYLADFDTGVREHAPSEKKDMFKGSCGQIQRRSHFAELMSRFRVLSRLLKVYEYIALTAVLKFRKARFSKKSIKALP